jgi:DNA-binding CsgD family transcriptional regulator
MTNDRISTRSSRNPRKAGRPMRNLTNVERRVMTFVEAGEITAAEAARMLGVHRSTVGSGPRRLALIRSRRASLM